MIGNYKLKIMNYKLIVELKMIIFSTICLLLLMSPILIQAGNLTIKTSTDTILIGDIYSFEMKVENIGNSKIFFPNFTDTLVNGKIEIIESYKEDTLENSVSKKWDLSIYDAGAYQINGFSVISQTENKFDTLISHEAMTIFVKSIAVDTSKAFKPIKAPLSIPYPIKDVAKKYIPYIIGLAILIALLFFIWYKYKNRHKPKYVKPKTALDYHKEAILKLKEIEKQKLWQNGKIKNYYLGISEVLRTYLEGRFTVNAMESTTDEIIDDFKELEENKTLTNKLKEVLQQCDLAKFAKFLPMGDENMRMMKIAQDFVAHTKPKEEIEKKKELENEKTTTKNG